MGIAAQRPQAKPTLYGGDTALSLIGVATTHDNIIFLVCITLTRRRQTTRLPYKSIDLD